jgi:hypothetical protein
MEQIECSETSAIINQTPGNHPKEDILYPKRLHAKFKTRRKYEIKNKKTVGVAYTLPGITEILDQLGQSKYFTCLHMVMVYHQIESARGEGQRTTFSSKRGHCEYRRLPFGLKMAPAVFQKIMNSVLSGLTSTHFVHLDNTIYARSPVDHNTKL